MTTKDTRGILKITKANNSKQLKIIPCPAQPPIQLADTNINKKQEQTI